MGVASLVLGIIGLVVAIFGSGFNWLAVVLGLIGTILGALGRKNPESKGLATAGMVMSIIALILGLLMYLACAACLGAAGAGLSSLS